MADPAVTIGLPVYNGGRYLDEALRSIRDQTFGDFVLVVSDNGSTDESVEIVRSHAADDARIELIVNEDNHGAAWNYNRVFAACRTPFFKWAAADDVLAPTCVERCHEVLVASGEETILAFPATQLIDAEGAPLRVFMDPLDTSTEHTARGRLRRIVANAVYGNVVFGLLRSAALRQTRGHGAYPSADLVLLAELALVGRFVSIDEPLFLRREHEQMSRRANRTPETIMRFFDPAARPVRNEYRRLYAEHVRAVRRAPLPRLERLRCLLVLTTTWIRRHDELRARFWHGRTTNGARRGATP